MKKKSLQLQNFSFNFFVLLSLSSFICGCDDWNLEKKTYPICENSSAILRYNISENLTGTFTLDSLKGVEVPIEWIVNNTKLTQTGTRVTYTFPSSGSYYISLKLTNKCGDVFNQGYSINVSNINFLVSSPNVLTTNSANFVYQISGSEISRISSLGICYSSNTSSPSVTTGTSIVQSVIPLANKLYSFKTSNLASGRTYFYRPYAVTPLGVIYGGVNSIQTPAYVQGSITKATPPFSGREGVISFAIDEKIYVGLGKDGTGKMLSDFYEYDLTKNSWSRKADFPGLPRRNSSSFVINGIAFVGLGFRGGSDQSNPNSLTNEGQDFWKYDPSTNKWTQITTFPGAGRAFAASFSIGGKGYISSGESTKNWGNVRHTYYSDTWEFDPTTELWVQKAPFGGGLRSRVTNLSISYKGYIGGGKILEPSVGYYTGQTTDANDLWEFDPLKNLWTKVNLPSGYNITTIAFSIQDKGYIGFTNSNGLLTLYSYGNSSIFSQAIGLNTSLIRTGMLITATNNSGFLGLGLKDNFLYNDLYMINP